MGLWDSGGKISVSGEEGKEGVAGLSFVNFCRIHISGISADEAAESGEFHEHALEQNITENAAKDSERHIYYVMVGGVDSGEPNPEGHGCQ